MAGAKNHDYHILAPDIWPIIGALPALTMAIGAIMWMHGGHLGPQHANGGGIIFFVGVAAGLTTMLSWWANVIREAHGGEHTPVVQLHLRHGMILFIASEVMFFVGWFWAFFDFSLFPANITWDAATQSVNLISDTATAVGQWPPKGLEVLNAWGFPLLNT